MSKPNALSYDKWGCKLNAVSVDDLFQLYTRAGFLYPAKLEKLSPFWQQVTDNWRWALSEGDSLLQVVTHSEPDHELGATVSCWRSTHTGWVMQHLVSVAGPLASRAVLLSQATVCGHDFPCGSTQMWFRRNNPFPGRVFGSIPDAIGSEFSWSGDFVLSQLPLIAELSPSRCVSVREASQADQLEVLGFVSSIRPSVYVAGEGLDNPDLLLDAVDEMYRRCGLRRYRRIFLASSAGRSAPVGVAICYRGPLGLNFSFLENRCELILANGIGDAERRKVTESLLHAIRSAYVDFEPGVMILTTDEAVGEVVLQLRGSVIRRYAQVIVFHAGAGLVEKHFGRLYGPVTPGASAHLPSDRTDSERSES